MISAGHDQFKDLSTKANSQQPAAGSREQGGSSLETYLASLLLEVLLTGFLALVAAGHGGGFFSGAEG